MFRLTGLQNQELSNTKLRVFDKPSATFLCADFKISTARVGSFMYVGVERLDREYLVDKYPITDKTAVHHHIEWNANDDSFEVRIDWYAGDVHFVIQETIQNLSEQAKYTNLAHEAAQHSPQDFQQLMTKQFQRHFQKFVEQVDESTYQVYLQG